MRKMVFAAAVLMTAAGLAACAGGVGGVGGKNASENGTTAGAGILAETGADAGAGGSAEAGAGAGLGGSAITGAGAGAGAAAEAGAGAGAGAAAKAGAAAGAGTEAGTSTSPASLTIQSLNASKSPIPLEVPYNPQRLAVLDMASLDILDALGLGSRVVGAADTSLDYLQQYTGGSTANLGTIKEADLEAVMASEPDVIFIGGRLASSYDALSEIAPVVYLATDPETGLVESVRENASIIASIFGLESRVEELMAGFDARINALSAFSSGKTAIVGMSTSGGFNVLGSDGRCSLISREAGFENIGVDAAADTSTHGNEASFEFIVKTNPDYVFVLDRDAAIGTDGAKLARDIVENELVMGTDAYKNGRIIYLAHPAAWYTAEGGITALDRMLADLEDGLL
ncbi:siderophore ABC transporter substrate-binding protein [Enterocloster lavalensis]|uniref:siderophore ABC transporter substrate-binding protein n=1 Tax=Enterocloster lavalensis TaxID=460384 RepID=UPI0023F2EAFE|nr:ABC transporter substrate-binding protein [Enterocloster lavalensis]